MRVKIHLDNNPESTEPRVVIQQMDGTLVHRVRKVVLHGEWIIRQYNNPVPCGERTVIYNEDPTAYYDFYP